MRMPSHDEYQIDFLVREKLVGVSVVFRLWEIDCAMWFCRLCASRRSRRWLEKCDDLKVIGVTKDIGKVENSSRVTVSRKSNFEWCHYYRTLEIP